MAKFITHRDASRTNWGRNVEGDRAPNVDDIQLGCLLRIADATEAMAKEYNRLLSEAKYLRQSRDEKQRTAERLARSNAALRGVIKRMKRKALPSSGDGGE